MTNIFIDIPILLEHQSQVSKDVFLRCHLTIKSNIHSFYVVVLKLYFTYFVLDLLSLIHFSFKVHLHNSNFWSPPVLLLSTKTNSSAKSIHQGISSCMSIVTSFIIKQIDKSIHQGKGDKKQKRKNNKRLKQKKVKRSR
jgi:hypothetical protein